MSEQQEQGLGWVAEAIRQQEEYLRWQVPCPVSYPDHRVVGDRCARCGAYSLEAVRAERWADEGGEVAGRVSDLG